MSHRHPSAHVIARRAFALKLLAHGCTTPDAAELDLGHAAGSSNATPPLCEEALGE